MTIMTIGSTLSYAVSPGLSNSTRCGTLASALRTRRGLTLVELLVVIVIFTMVTAATIPLMAPSHQSAKGSRIRPPVGNHALAGAGTRLSTGRPVGVWIERLSNVVEDSREHVSRPVPVRGSAAVFRRIDDRRLPHQRSEPARSPIVPPTAKVARRGWATPMLPPNLIRQGDQIQFNYRGHIYKIIGLGPTPRGTSTEGSLSFNRDIHQRPCRRQLQRPRCLTRSSGSR